MNLLTARSDRVKCVDFHPTEPWILASLYSGIVTIWNYQTQTLVKSIEVSELPVRTARFVGRKNWVVTGSDDLVVRVFNYNTMERVAAFEGHSDYVRAIAVHPTRPYILTGSDDMTVKLWDWERGWKNMTTYEGHQHYVMAVVFNPKDPNTFATASLDRTIKVWSLTATTANYSLEGHAKGVNTVAYYGGADKPYLVSGADDATVRVWDYQTKACVRILEGHGQNVSAVLFHPDLPLVVSGSEDGTIKMWNSSTFRLESTVHLSLERVWTLACAPTGAVSAGCDEGMAVMALGRGEPVASMDANGKVIWARHHEILSTSVKVDGCPDGERIPVTSKELGTCDLYPQQLEHSPNGRFVVVLGDGEYTVYTAVAWRNKCFGKAMDFVWAANGSNDFCVRDSPSKITIWQNFAEAGSIRTSGVDRLFGGALIGISQGGQLCLYDWNDGNGLVRRIDVQPTHVFWSESKKMAICTDDEIYLLAYHESIFQAGQEAPSEDGVEAAIELIDQINESVVSGCWVGECFVFVNRNNRIGYHIGGRTFQLAVHDHPLFVLGFLPDRLYLIDKDANMVSFGLALAVLEYQTAIVQRDFALASTLLPTVPADQQNRVAQFLESQDLIDQALTVATDPDYRFELALKLGKLDFAFDICSTLESAHQWRLLGDRALAEWKVALAEKCFAKGKDLASLFLLYAASANVPALANLASMAAESGQCNIAFAAWFAVGKREECLELLVKTARFPEAAFFARSYLPSAIERVVEQWRAGLTKGGHRAASLLADPSSRPDLFPEFARTQQAEAKGRSRSVSFDNVSSSDPSALMMPLETSDLQLTSPHDAFSDHLSMEVNTTGTGSVRAEDVDELIAMRNEEGGGVGGGSLRFDRLSIHDEEPELCDLEDDHDDDRGIKKAHLFSEGGRISGGSVSRDKPAMDLALDDDWN